MAKGRRRKSNQGTGLTGVIAAALLLFGLWVAVQFGLLEMIGEMLVSDLRPEK